MQYGDIEGKGKIYTDAGTPMLARGERIMTSLPGMLHRGWIRHKLGWRTIMFKGYGSFYLTNDRIIYLEEPEYIQKIHTFNLDHEIGDFGGWDYHAHRLRRAAKLNAHLFFNLPFDEITGLKHKNNQTIILTTDSNNKYKIVIDQKIGQEIEKQMIKTDSKLRVK